MTRTTIAYPKRRYFAPEEEITNALHQNPTDHLAIADLKCRKLVIADEILQNRRLVEHFAKLARQLSLSCIANTSPFATLRYRRLRRLDRE
jgi:hypothetical protein